MGNSASSEGGGGGPAGIDQPGMLHRKKYGLPTSIRRSTVASGSSTEQTTSRAHAARRSMGLVDVPGEENLKNVELLYEIDPLDLKLYRHLNDGVVRDIQTDAVWATIPHALNGRPSKALLVDRHQRILTKRDQSKIAQELKHHVHLSTRYCQTAQSDPAFSSHQAYVPKIQELQHPHILRLFGHFTLNRKLHLLTEFCSHGNLMAVLEFDERFQQKHGDDRRLPIFHGSQALKESARQLCVGVLFMHESQLVHTNLTPENVFVNSKGHLMVGDFKDAIFVGGMSDEYPVASLAAAGATTTTIPHAFAAPERVSCTCTDGRTDLLKADAWSTGMLIFFMATRQQLFKVASVQDPEFVQFQQLGFAAFYDVWKTQRRNRSDSHVQVPEEMKPLLSELLQVDPAVRCTLADATQRHEWLGPRLILPEMDPSQWKLTA